MSKFLARIKKTLKREEGASLAEYGMLLGLIAVVCIVAVGLLGGYINSAFTAIGTALSTI